MLGPAAGRTPACGRPATAAATAMQPAAQRPRGPSSSSSLKPADGDAGGGARAALCSLHQRLQQQQQQAPRLSVACAAAAGEERGGMPEEDQTIRVKCMLAEGSGKLDLSECELSTVPPAALVLEGLEELSLAGNRLTALPTEVGQLGGHLSRLQLAGNSLGTLPPSLCDLSGLEGFWLHGNQLESLPADLGRLSALTQLSLSGNRLAELPPSVSGLTALVELACAGNQLTALPPGIGSLASLAKLHLHGNQLSELPSSVTGLSRLTELCLQGNPRLALLPDTLGTLPALKDLSAADCALVAVPASLGEAPALETLSLYGNQLYQLPPNLLQAPQLKTVWLEGNPLTPEAVAALLQALPSSTVKTLGLDEQQLSGLPPTQRELLVAAAGRRLRVSRVVGSGPGYFKLDSAAAEGVPADPAAAVAAPADDGASNGAGAAAAAAGDAPAAAAAAAANGAAAGPPSPAVRQQAEVLVVSFGSAPGTPNWGGLLKKVRAAATTPQEADFDVLYVVDPHRSWYRGGDNGYGAYESRLAAAVAPYKHVVYIGDSMGGTAALLFAHLATEVHAWTPQVDLAISSIRPGERAEWQAALRARVLDSVSRCEGRVTVHTGSWRHDLDQARCLPAQPGLKVQIYSVDSHRLALALDRRGMLVQIVRSAVLQSMGLLNKEGLRVANLF